MKNGLRYFAAVKTCFRDIKAPVHKCISLCLMEAKYFDGSGSISSPLIIFLSRDNEWLDTVKNRVLNLY